jgi:hypothetical protein
MCGVERLRLRGESVGTSSARGSPNPKKPKGLTTRTPLCMMRNRYYMYLANLWGAYRCLKCTNARRGPYQADPLEGSDWTLRTQQRDPPPQYRP